MKNLGVIYDNFFPQNLAKSREPREVVVTPIQSKFNWENLSRLCTFSPQIFLKHLFLQYILIIYCKIKRRVLKKMATTKIRFFSTSRYLSHFWIFSPKIFIKCLILGYILIIWWKIWVLLTIIFYLKIWLSPESPERLLLPLYSQSSTEKILVVFALFHLKFSWNIFFYKIF